MRNFGITSGDDVSYVGVNAKMSEACAAMGLTSLESLEEFRGHNAANYRRYHANLAGTPGVRLFEFDEREQNNYQYVVVEIDEEACGIDRDSMNRLLHAENIIARRYFYPGCHMMPAYRTGISLHNTELLASRTLALPTGTSIDVDQIEEICHVIRFAAERGPQIMSRMGRASPAVAA
jgi:dTDP-4-amino-4,6-dideoxygalactose transaminase